MAENSVNMTPTPYEDGDQECGLLPDGKCRFAGTDFCNLDCGRTSSVRHEDGADR